MSAFVKTRGGWGLCFHTPKPPAAGGFVPLPNSGCATGQANEVLPPPEILGWLRH